MNDKNKLERPFKVIVHPDYESMEAFFGKNEDIKKRMEIEEAHIVELKRLLDIAMSQFKLGPYEISYSPNGPRLLKPDTKNFDDVEYNKLHAILEENNKNEWFDKVIASFNRGDLPSYQRDKAVTYVEMAHPSSDRKPQMEIEEDEISKHMVEIEKLKQQVELARLRYEIAKYENTKLRNMKI